MAHKILGNYAAREGAYFKSEQEADLQRHRQRLVQEGVLPSNVVRPDPKSTTESLHAFEVLPEVLQQEARLDEPDAAARREFERRVKGRMAPLTAQERWRYRNLAGTLGQSVGHMPRVSLGRGRYDVPQPPPTVGPPSIRTLSPEAQEVARRTYIAGLRSLIYGSLLGIGALAVAGTYAFQSAGLSSPGVDVGQSLREALLPIADRVRSGLQPVRETLAGWAAAGTASDEQRSELQRRMINRIRPQDMGLSKPT